MIPSYISDPNKPMCVVHNIKPSSKMRLNCKVYKKCKGSKIFPLIPGIQTVIQEDLKGFLLAKHPQP